MKGSLFGAVVLAAVALIVVTGAAASTPTNPPSGVTSNDFSSNTAGWFEFTGGYGTIDQRPSGYANLGGYASGMVSDGGHARLERGICRTDSGGSGPAVQCWGPYTDWGNLNHYTWNGPYTTQVDIYLDTAYANANPDTYGGNMAGLSLDETPAGEPTNPAKNGTRFDYTSAINKSTPDANGNADHLRDFGFNVSTGYADDGCDGFMVTGQTNVNRINANPNIGQHNPQCIDETGWYTFKHSFSEKTGYLDVLMQIIDKDTSMVVASWDITGIDKIEDVGCNRYGMFSNQEIWGLPIDNASMTGGCAAPTITDGQILPTGTTCQAYDAGANPLATVQYTLTKGGNINSVAPGVFFYYGTISGTAGQTFTITQTDDSVPAPFVPVQHGQVILYDTSCNVLKGWNPDTDANGVVTGTLPSTGTFIISVKYSPADLKGLSNPGTVTYTIDGTSITVAPKPKA
jgi:hypothetical protein